MKASSLEPACAAPKIMATPRRFLFFFCGRGKVGGGYNSLVRDESFESCLNEQRFSVPCVTFCFNYFSNTTSPALSGGKLDRCASGIGLHSKWVRETL